MALEEFFSVGSLIGEFCLFLHLDPYSEYGSGSGYGSNLNPDTQHCLYSMLKSNAAKRFLFKQMHVV